MAHYRVYLLNHLGTIFHGEDVDAPDDATAVTAARQLLETHNAGGEPDIAYGVEIWRGSVVILNSWNNPFSWLLWQVWKWRVCPTGGPDFRGGG
jgi:hypothetical protein